MQLQLLSFLIWLGIAVVIALVFFVVAYRSRQAQVPNTATVNRFRLALLGTLFVLAVLFLAVTLPKTPYPMGTEQPDKVVFVAAKQFAFAITDEPVTTEEEWLDATSFGGPVEISRGDLVEFRVTSLDVNHGFSLYDPQGNLLGQVQAMPGYLNRLRYRFDTPGLYVALCLEYCGNSHHTMRGVFNVK